MTASGIYEGATRHRRLEPTNHELRMPLYLLLLDHDEMAGPDGPTAPGGALDPDRRWWPARYRRSDYLDGDADRPLGEAVKDLVETRTGVRPEGPVRTLTQVRTTGYVFNPITVHYCLAPHGDATGPRLEAVVLEVTNTPWQERHCYVIDARPGAVATPPGTTPTEAVAVGRIDDHGRLRAEMPKALHVSPFMALDQTYHLSCTPPGERLWLRLETFVDEASGPRRVFVADLALRRHALDLVTLARMLVVHPLLTRRVWLGIHAHALALAAKRVPFVRHPVRSDREPDTDQERHIDQADGEFRPGDTAPAHNSCTERPDPLGDRDLFPAAPRTLITVE